MPIKLMRDPTYEHTCEGLRSHPAYQLTLYGSVVDWWLDGIPPAGDSFRLNRLTHCPFCGEKLEVPSDN